MTGIVLILGASGRFGRHAAEAFWNAGWQVRPFNRTTDDLPSAAKGADVIVNGWNPPYTEWERQVPELTRQVIGAAQVSGAAVLIPGNIYGYGAGSSTLLGPNTPKAATNPLGRIRNEMEEAYRTAGVPTIVLRAGDFIDTEPSGNWFDKIITARLPRGVVTAPGSPKAPHAWAYLPDMARAAVALAELSENLKPFHEVLFPGYTLSLREMNVLLSKVAGRPLTLKQMSWAPLWVTRPFWPMAGKLIEMRYLWDMPHVLDAKGFHTLVPDFRPTEPLAALTSAVRHLDVHPDQPVARGTFDVAAH